MFLVEVSKCSLSNLDRFSFPSNTSYFTFLASSTILKVGGNAMSVIEVLKIAKVWKLGGKSGNI